MNPAAHLHGCDVARLHASLAVDGELDDVGRAQLARHLGRCADCAQLALGMEAAAKLLRHAPPEPFRCTLRRKALLRSTSSTSGRHWAGAAAAVAAIVLVAGALPERGTTPQQPRPTAGYGGAGTRLSPLELPIGQRSAMDDFAAPAPAATAPRHLRG